MGGLGTPCRSVIKYPPTTHSFRLTERGSRQLGWQGCRGVGVKERGGCWLSLCVGVRSHPGPLQLKVHRTILYSSPVHMYTKSHMCTDTVVSSPEGIFISSWRWLLNCLLICSCFSFTAHLNLAALFVCVCAFLSFREIRVASRHSWWAPALLFFIPT